MIELGEDLYLSKAFLGEHGRIDILEFISSLRQKGTSLPHCFTLDGSPTQGRAYPTRAEWDHHPLPTYNPHVMLHVTQPPESFQCTIAFSMTFFGRIIDRRPL